MPTYSRQALYDLVWSTPMKTLAAAHGISDVGLKKVCAKAGVPVPERGYWAKHAAGLPVKRQSLPLRDPGRSDDASWGPPAPGRGWPPDFEKIVAQPLPDPPVFDEPMESVAERIRKRLGKVQLIRDLDLPHPDIRRLFEKDDKRRAKIAEWSFYATSDPPVFDAPFERRRLRLINSLFLGLARVGCKGLIGGNAGRSVSVVVGDTRVTLELDHPDAKPDRHGQEKAFGGAGGPLRLQAPSSDPTEDKKQIWIDDDAGKLEQKLTDIAVAVVLAGEAIHRRSQQWSYDYAVKRRQEDLAELAKQRAAATEAERKRRAEEARQQRETLMGQARSWREAADLRAFVAMVQEIATDRADVAPWAGWALGVADALDPIKNGSLALGQPPIVEKAPDA